MPELRALMPLAPFDEVFWSRTPSPAPPSAGSPSAQFVRRVSLRRVVASNDLVEPSYRANDTSRLHQPRTTDGRPPPPPLASSSKGLELVLDAVSFRVLQSQIRLEWPSRPHHANSRTPQPSLSLNLVPAGAKASQCGRRQPVSGLY